jgi:hypothetical protein
MKKKACITSPPLQKGWLKTLLLMKLTAFIILVTALQVSAKTFSQDKLDVDFKKTKLAAALKEVEKKTDYRFVFSNLVLSDKMKVTLKAKGITVENLLNRLLDNTGLSYSLMDNNLVVITKAAGIIYADITVRGKVTDNKGEPLAGVSVGAGDKSGTTTNEKGEYAITVDENATLSFSYVGYTSQQVQVNKRSQIDIVLVQLSNDLTDVVVVGYSSQARRKLTSAVVTVSGEELNKRVATNPAALLQGQLPGLQEIQGSGEPCIEGVNLRIRGTSTFSGAGNDHLVIVHGLPGSLSVLNPNDI